MEKSIDVKKYEEPFNLTKNVIETNLDGGDISTDDFFGEEAWNYYNDFLAADFDESMKEAENIDVKMPEFLSDERNNKSVKSESKEKNPLKERLEMFDKYNERLTDCISEAEKISSSGTDSEVKKDLEELRQAQRELEELRKNFEENCGMLPEEQLEDFIKNSSRDMDGFDEFIAGYEKKYEEYENSQKEKQSDMQKKANRDDEYLENLRRLAQQDMEKMDLLGFEYYDRGNIYEALTCFDKAAEQGYSPSQRNLAIMLEGNESEDVGRIFELYSSAAKQEDVIALNNLGCCYMNGEGTEVDYKKAVDCFEKAAKMEDELAMFNLAGCYSLGAGIRQNKKKAFNLYLEAAERGNTDAIRKVAECYLNGDGIGQSLDKAKTYYTMAAEKGDELSKQALEDIKTRIAPQKYDFDRSKIYKPAEKLAKTAEDNDRTDKKPNKSAELSM